MNKEEKDGKKQKKEGEDMSALVEKKRSDLKEKLDKISANSPILKGKGNMVKLDPQNPQHKEWFEVDKYKGK